MANPLPEDTVVSVLTEAEGIGTVPNAKQLLIAMWFMIPSPNTFLYSVGDDPPVVGDVYNVRLMEFGGNGVNYERSTITVTPFDGNLWPVDDLVFIPPYGVIGEELPVYGVTGSGEQVNSWTVRVKICGPVLNTQFNVEGAYFTFGAGDGTEPIPCRRDLNVHTIPFTGEFANYMYDHWHHLIISLDIDDPTFVEPTLYPIYDWNDETVAETGGTGKGKTQWDYTLPVTFINDYPRAQSSATAYDWDWGVWVTVEFGWLWGFSYGGDGLDITPTDFGSVEIDTIEEAIVESGLYSGIDEHGRPQQDGVVVQVSDFFGMEGGAYGQGPCSSGIFISEVNPDYDPEVSGSHPFRWKDTRPEYPPFHGTDNGVRWIDDKQRTFYCHDRNGGGEGGGVHYYSWSSHAVARDYFAELVGYPGEAGIQKQFYCDHGRVYVSRTNSGIETPYVKMQVYLDAVPALAYVQIDPNSEHDHAEYGKVPVEMGNYAVDFNDYGVWTEPDDTDNAIPMAGTEIGVPMQKEDWSVDINDTPFYHIPGWTYQPDPAKVQYYSVEMWVNKGFVDLSDPATLAKFIKVEEKDDIPNAAGELARRVVGNIVPLDEAALTAYQGEAGEGNPVTLMSLAAAPNNFGKPDVAFYGGPGTFIHNKGTGGDFELTGDVEGVPGPKNIPIPPTPEQLPPAPIDPWGQFLHYDMYKAMLMGVIPGSPEYYTKWKDYGIWWFTETLSGRTAQNYSNGSIKPY